MRGAVWLAVVALAVAAAGGVWWWTAPSDTTVSIDHIGDRVQTVARGQLPVFAAKPDVGALYRFATEQGDLLRYMPCTCGCGDLGHGSNRACYIKAETSERITYTSHAAT
jgi:Protein of unknown function with PCYCGC motif